MSTSAVGVAVETLRLKLEPADFQRDADLSDPRKLNASRADLLALVREKKFREDLYYALSVLPINVPPLRERPEDVIPMIRYFLNKNNQKLQEHKTIDSNAMAILIRYPWPGNVRELENIIERLVITTRKDTILPENLPGFLLESAAAIPNYGTILDSDENLREALELAERTIFARAYAKYHSTRKIARALGISQPTVVRRLAKYKIATFDSE